MLIKNLTTLLGVFLAESTSKISNEPFSKTCIDRIFEHLDPQSVWFSTTSDFFNLKKVVENHPFSTKTPESEITHLNYGRHTRNYVIEVTNLTSLERDLETFKELSSWNSQAKFFIVSFNDSKEILSGIVEKLWYDGINRFIIITASEVVKVYRWQPYRCQNGVDKPRLLDVCKRGVFLNNTDFFPGKIPIVFDWCELKVGAVEWPPYVMKPTQRVANTDQYTIKEGLEIGIVETISKKLHLNISYIMSEKQLNWGDLYDNGTGTGLMALLRKKSVDMAVGALTPSLSKFRFFEISRHYYFESYYWCVPHAEAQLPWTKIVNAISYQMWILLFFSLFIVSLLLWVLSTTKETLFRSYIYCLQTSVSVLLNIAIPHDPKTQILRWILIFWIFFSLNFSVFYETSLVSILMKPTFDSQISSLEDILDKDLNILVPIHSLNKNSTFNAEFLNRSEDCTDMKECFSRIVNNKNTALFLSSSYSYYIKKSYVTADNIPLIYCFPSNVVTYPVVALMKRGFPLAPLFNSIISRLVEGGFVNLWAQQIYNQKWMDEEMSTNVTSNNMLKLQQLSSAFSFLFFGLLLAAIVFVGEVIYFFVTFLKGKHVFIV